MNSIYWVFFIGLLMNIPSLAPVLFLRKVSKKIKVSLALRLFLLNAFLVISLVTVSQNTTQKYGQFPAWLVFAAIVLFMVILVPTVRFIRKHLTVGKSRGVILSSFLIVYAVRFHSVFSNINGSGYTLNGYNTVWTLFFLFACLLAYLGCAGSKTYSGYSAPSSAPQPDYFKPNKEYETQSQIDYDIAVKGRSVLSDPNLNIVETQRYIASLEIRDTDNQ
ncbi:membrane protein [Pectobacterium brasiliense]|uniref:membrane protein n=1 Tax=Pectobacterium brasiliense TaxID=180957 RepID=UPI00057FD543|nr:membrane protein [Pectobacterium brasiliense]KHS76248.1 membrane protein [Pectobacterium brasiliense]KHT09771.1 membrane protein [Pectobacterium brasiliense]